MIWSLTDSLTFYLNSFPLTLHISMSVCSPPGAFIPAVSSGTLLPQIAAQLALPYLQAFAQIVPFTLSTLPAPKYCQIPNIQLYFSFFPCIFFQNFFPGLKYLLCLLFIICLSPFLSPLVACLFFFTHVFQAHVTVPGTK